MRIGILIISMVIAALCAVEGMGLIGFLICTLIVYAVLCAMFPKKKPASQASSRPARPPRRRHVFGPSRIARSAGDAVLRWGAGIDDGPRTRKQAESDYIMYSQLAEKLGNTEEGRWYRAKAEAAWRKMHE